MALVFKGMAQERPWTYIEQRSMADNAHFICQTVGPDWGLHGQMTTSD